MTGEVAGAAIALLGLALLGLLLSIAHGIATVHERRAAVNLVVATTGSYHLMLHLVAYFETQAIVPRDVADPEGLQAMQLILAARPHGTPLLWRFENPDNFSVAWRRTLRRTSTSHVLRWAKQLALDMARGTTQDDSQMHRP